MLPILAAQYRSRDLNEVEGRRHKPPADFARGLVGVLARWFLARGFIVLGGGYASHGLVPAAAHAKESQAP